MKGTTAMASDTERAGDFFTGYARQFDDLYDTQKKSGLVGWINRTLRKSMAIRFGMTLRSLQPMDGASVLDIGCGSGRYIVPCLKLGARQIVGIDMSRTMLDLARAAVVKSGTDSNKVHLVQGDFLTVPLPTRFDYAIVMGVMDYISDAEAFLDKLAGCFGRTAVLSFPAAENVWRWQRQIRYRLRGCPLHFYTRRRLEALLARTKVESWTVQKIDRDYFVMLQNSA